MGFKRRRAGTARGLKTRSHAASSSVEGLPRRTVELLGRPVEPALLAERETRDGRLVQYIEGWAAISQANRIFGFDAWGAEVVGDVAYRALNLFDPDSGDRLAVGMYSANVKVIVRGCLPRLDVGCAFAANDTPEAHEAAFKGAVTDAMKRALRHFGAQFGNELYNRRAEANGSESQSPGPATTGKLNELRVKVFDLSARLGADAAKAETWAEKRYGHSLDGLTAEQLADAVRTLAGQLNRRNGASPKRPNAQAEAA
jgi:DNA recombination protein Rad52